MWASTQNQMLAFAAEKIGVVPGSAPSQVKFAKSL
jgi:hypothetical protein